MSGERFKKQQRIYQLHVGVVTEDDYDGLTEWELYTLLRGAQHVFADEVERQAAVDFDQDVSVTLAVAINMEGER